MGKIHKPYPEEVRCQMGRQMVGLVRAGRNPYDLAREFELSRGDPHVGETGRPG